MAGELETSHRLAPNEVIPLFTLELIPPEIDQVDFVVGTPGDGTGTLKLHSVICGVTEYSTTFTPDKILTMKLAQSDPRCKYFAPDFAAILSQQDTSALADIFTRSDRKPSPPQRDDFDLTSDRGIRDWQIRLLDYYQEPLRLVINQMPVVAFRNDFQQEVLRQLTGRISVDENPSRFVFTLPDESVDELILLWREAVESGFDETVLTHDDLGWLDLFAGNLLRLSRESILGMSGTAKDRIGSFQTEIAPKLIPAVALSPGGPAGTGSSNDSAASAPGLDPNFSVPPAEQEDNFPWLSGLVPAVAGIAFFGAAAMASDNKPLSRGLATTGGALTGFGANQIGNHVSGPHWWSREAGVLGSAGAALVGGALGFGVSFAVGADSPSGEGTPIPDDPDPQPIKPATGTTSTTGQRGGRGK